jgi:Tfp pilus assembly protein PilF
MLARVEGLRVVARSSAFQYKGRNVDVRQIGRELNVAAVVEGTIRRDGRRIRISAQVADTSDGFQRWQRTWERPFEDAPRLHEEIARGIAHALNAPPPGETFLLGKRTANAEAYRLVVEARYLTPTTLENAAIRIAHYRKAAGYDPAYAAAWVGMADTWSRLANAAEVPPHQVMTQAREAAAKALELDSTLADAHLLAAGIHWNYDWDWPAADREFRRAIQLDPDSSTIRNFYAQYLAQMGRFAEAFKEIEGMRTLEPLAAGSRTMEAQVYFLSRQYDRTIHLCQTVLESHADIWGLRYWLGCTYGSMGDLRRSTEILEALHPAGALEGRGFGMLGATYAAAGRRSDALGLLERAMQRGRQRYVSPVSIAQIHIGLGDYDEAFEWLEKGYGDRDATMTTLKVEPAFDAVRTDPRFVSLLSRLKLQ